MVDFIQKQDLAPASFDNDNSLAAGGITVRTNAGSAVGTAIAAAIAAIPDWTPTVSGEVRQGVDGTEVIDNQYSTRVLSGAELTMTNTFSNSAGLSIRQVVAMTLLNTYIWSSRTYTIGVDFSNVAAANAWLAKRRIAGDAIVTLQFPAGTFAINAAPASHPDGDRIIWAGATMVAPIPAVAAIPNTGMSAAQRAADYASIVTLLTGVYGTTLTLAVPALYTMPATTTLTLRNLFVVGVSFGGASNTRLIISGCSFANPTLVPLTVSGMGAVIAASNGCIAVTSTGGHGLFANRANFNLLSGTGYFLGALAGVRSAQGAIVAMSFGAGGLATNGGTYGTIVNYGSLLTVLSTTGAYQAHSDTPALTRGGSIAVGSGGLMNIALSGAADIRSYSVEPAIRLSDGGRLVVEPSLGTVAISLQTAGQNNVVVDGGGVMSLAYSNITCVGATASDFLVQNAGTVVFNPIDGVATHAWSGAGVLAVQSDRLGRTVAVQGTGTYTGSLGVSPPVNTAAVGGAYNAV